MVHPIGAAFQTGCIVNTSTVLGESCEDALNTLGAILPVPGPQGPQGVQGPQGPQGNPGTPAYTAQITSTLYVDNKRTDEYTANGDISKPFKTIQAAINQVITNANNTQSNPYCIRIAPGVYPENLVMESLNIVSLILIGEGSRLQTQINPPSGYSLQSVANNANLYDLHMENIQFIKPTMMVGDTNGTYFGYNFFFVDCYWPSTAAATFKNMVYPSFYGYVTKFSGGLTLSNVTQAGMLYTGGFKSYPGFTIETDENANKPNSFGSGTAVVVTGTTVTNVSWSLLNIVTKTGTALQLRGCRHGSAGETIPLNATIIAYYSTLVGNYINNGTLTLYNSQVTGSLSGTAPTLYQFSGQIKNDSTVTGTTIKDALQHLDTQKLETNGISGSFTTVDLKTITVVNGQITAIA